MARPGTKHIRDMMRLADELGWQITVKNGRTTCHLVFTKPGCPPVYASSTPGDHRERRNVVACLLRAERGVPT